MRTYTVPGSVELVGTAAGKNEQARSVALASANSGTQPPDVLYFQQPYIGGSVAQHVGALDLNSGRVLWTYTIPSSVPAGIIAVGGTALDVLTGDNAMTALDVHRGTLLWRTQLAGTSNVTVGFDSVITDGTSLYVISPNFGVEALRASDGGELWSYASAPDYAHEQLQIDDASMADGMLYLAAIRPQATTDARGHVVNPETVYALDAATGTLRWKYATASPQKGWLALGTDTVFIRADDGLHAIRASDGARLWLQPGLATQGYSWTSPSAVNEPIVAVGSVVVDAHYDWEPTLICIVHCPVREYAYALSASGGTPYWRVPILPRELTQPRWTL